MTDTTFLIRLSAAEKAAWVKLAKKNQRTLAAEIRYRMNKAAGRKS